MGEKILYIDVPFLNENGGDKNRSKFLWNKLSGEMTADILILTNDKTYSLNNSYNNCTKQFQLSYDKKTFFSSSSIFYFSKKEKNRFKEIIKNGKYTTVFLRMMCTAELAKIVKKISPEIKIIFDVDMLFSRIASLSWKKSRSIKNRYYFFEKNKLKRYEKKFFNYNYLFLFSNPLELEFAQNRYLSFQSRGKFDLIPNFMKEIDQSRVKKTSRMKSENNGKNIIFFGTLNSAANLDGFHFLIKKIYPLIESTLEKNNMTINIVGKNITVDYKDLVERLKIKHINIIGAVENIDEWIGGAQFCLLPLRIASGTRTRILEAAANKRAVVTTAIGVEGLNFNKDEIIIEDKEQLIAEEIIKLIESPSLSEDYGKKLYSKSIKHYSENNIGNNLINIISDYNPCRKRIALVLNRFYPEVGGAETNLFFQANELSKKYDLTVFSPRRLKISGKEFKNGFKIKRLYDILNPMNSFPNLKAKTLCPSIFFKILSGNFDIVQCFPAINYNIMLSYFAAKIRKIPIILCSFDLLDYSEIIKKNGTIDPDLLNEYKPDWKRKFFMKGFNHIFSISNREMNVYKRYNENVSYSPVPILTTEYDKEVDDPRKKYEISSSKFIYLVLGRVSKIKGQDIALQAFLKIQNKVKDALLVFVGRTDYDPEILSEMKAAIEKEKLENRVIFTGMVSRDEVLGWLKNSSIHVIPVRFMNSGAVVVETWVSGRPVIQSTAVDPNLVVEGENGYLFPYNDVEILSEKMLKAFKDKGKLSKYGQNGRDMVLKNYTYEELIKIYEKVYSNLL